MFASFPTLKICTSVKLFTFLVSTFSILFILNTLYIYIKNDFSATVFKVLGFSGVMSYVSVFNIHIEEINDRSTFP